MTQQNLSSFIWSVADLLRGDYKQSEYGRVILPFTVLRRLECHVIRLERQRAEGIQCHEKRWSSRDGISDLTDFRVSPE